MLALGSLVSSLAGLLLGTPTCRMRRMELLSMFIHDAFTGFAS